MDKPITLPWPPSYNRYWRNGRNGGFISKEGMAFKVAAQDALLQQLDQREVLEGAVRVDIHLFRPIMAGDIDNRAKVVLDALQGFCYVDDKQVCELHMYRHEDKKEPRVEVVVSEVQS